MARCLPMLDATLLFGVEGAAFDFHTGRIRDCAQWMKLAGLQWLDRHLRAGPAATLATLFCETILHFSGISD